MSDVSKTSDLIGRLRSMAADIDELLDDPESLMDIDDVAVIINEAADTLAQEGALQKALHNAPGHTFGEVESCGACLATRVPVQGEPNDDREALRDEFRSYLGDEIYVSSRDHSAWEHGTMGLDDFSLAAEDDEIIESLVSIALSRPTVPDAATEGRMSLAELEDIAETHAFCADRLFLETEEAQRQAGRADANLRDWDAASERADKAEAERDAALAAVERVRALETFSITDSYPAWTAVDRDELLAALDGTPEPEWEYGFELIEPDDRNVFEREGDFISAAFAYRAAKKRIDEEHQADLPRLQYMIVRRRKAAPWLPVEGEKP